MILQFQNPILVSILNREKYRALVSLNPFEKRLIKCVELNKHENKHSCLLPPPSPSQIGRRSEQVMKLTKVELGELLITLKCPSELS